LQLWTFIAYLAAAALFIVGIRRLRRPETARSGNTLAAVGMVIALVATIFVADIDRVLGALEIGAGVLVGSMIGAVAAQRVQMTAMPQMVAAFNGVGGAAAALVAVSEFYRVEALGVGQETLVSAITVLLSVIIGTISFSGSIIAFVKLQELALGGSVTFPLQQVVNALIALAILLLAANIVAGGAIAEAVGLPLSPLVSLYVILGLALLLGVLFVIPIGGADMPIVISLLNAFTGLAAAASGFVLDNYALIISGTLVGASGTVLTQNMSSALGRPLGKIIFAGIAASGTSQGGGAEDREVHDASAGEVGEILADEAEKIVIVPGYGLAVAQAQGALRELTEALESEGKEVLFGIHPVAGRMPGHMNVLLTEVGIPYEKLYDLEEINPEFEETDAAIIVGANDVVNPAANDPEQDSPISGMPILNVEAADRVIFIKRSLSPGFAGVDNPLFYDTEKTMMLFSDAKQGLQDVTSALKNS
jgi:H+-translocating NAD(P) transhydrogenase subunit beta